MPTITALRQARRLRSIRTRHTTRMLAVLPAFFSDQAQRVLDRWEHFSNPRKAIRDELMPAEEDHLLYDLVISIETSATLAVGAIAADMVGGQPFLGRTDPRLRQLLNQAGGRIVGINDTTRRAVQQTILNGYGAGYSDYQIAHGVPADGFRGLQSVVEETYSGRAEAIARTEIGVASELAAHDRFDAGGIQFVEWMDGPDCGIDAHGVGPFANGLIVPIHFAQAHPLAHPRCRRISLPYRAGLPTSGNLVPIPAIAGAAV